MYDPVIYPMESSWFGEIDSSNNVLPMEKTRIYKDNLFGLKTLDETGRISKHVIEGAHLQFLSEHII